MPLKFCVSEAEARKKICPHLVPDIWREPRADNEMVYRVVDHPRCLASGCMMWRYVETHIKDADGDLTALSGDTHGYCGIGGPPPEKARI